MLKLIHNNVSTSRNENYETTFISLTYNHYTKNRFEKMFQALSIKVVYEPNRLLKMDLKFRKNPTAIKSIMAITEELLKHATASTWHIYIKNGRNEKSSVADFILWTF